MPEKLADGEEQAIGLSTECDRATSYCWKTDTPAGIGQGCGEDEFGDVFELLFGTMSDSCNTITLGDSYEGCACHSDKCNTASQMTPSNTSKRAFLSTVIVGFYIWWT